MLHVAELACVVCGSWPVAVHHALTGGLGHGRKNHMLVLPLCFSCHQGERGIHTLGRKAWQAKYGMESELLEKVAARCGCQTCKEKRE